MITVVKCATSRAIYINGELHQENPSYYMDWVNAFRQAGTLLLEETTLVPYKGAAWVNSNGYPQLLKDIPQELIRNTIER